MCGIIGYKGNKNASEIVINGLKKLEYRGYDSWGIASVGNPEMNVLKKVGKISDFSIDKYDFAIANIGLGHTRWATHGGVTEKNAHPHLCCKKEIAIVHNGIFENYQELKNELKGHKFISETDTEVFVHLIEDIMNKNKNIKLEEAVKKALSKTEGRFAVVAINKTDNKLVGARNGSPLVVGVNLDDKNKEYFIASDVSAFLEYTKDVIFLNDDEMVVVDEDIKFYDIGTGKEIKKKISRIEWTLEEAEKGEYKHFMIKEIMEQNQTIRRTIQQDEPTVQKIADEINKAKGTFLVACGTASYAALAASYLFSKVAKKHINVVIGSEFPNYVHFLTKKTLVIAVSQSGETADTLEAIKAAKSKGSKIIAIVNVMGSSLMREANHAFLINAGPEKCVLATKSYTSQLALLTMLAYACAGKLKEGGELLQKTASHVNEILTQNYIRNIERLAEMIKNQNHVYIIGRSLNFASALEAALKIKEVSYIHAEGFAGGELKHGVIALIEKGTPCIAFVANDETKKEILSNAMELKSRGGFIIGISPENNEIFDFHINVADVGNASPIINVIPIQLLAYNLALKRNCDPDKPRNLAKSVTVK